MCILAPGGIVRSHLIKIDTSRKRKTVFHSMVVHDKNVVLVVPKLIRQSHYGTAVDIFAEQCEEMCVLKEIERHKNNKLQLETACARKMWSNVSFQKWHQRMNYN